MFKAKLENIKYLGLLSLLPAASCATVPTRIELLVPHRLQGSSYWCVPASASMVLAYYGDNESQKYLKELAGYRTDFMGTWFSDMIAGVRKLGYHWRSNGFGLDHIGFEEGMVRIKHDLADHRPVLISTSSPPVGHTMVVIAYDDSAQCVQLLDPARPDPGKRILSYIQLEHIWHDDFANSAERWILETWPR